jgi:hypothetical protein
MGLFRRKKKYEDTSPSGEGATHEFHGRESAHPLADQAQTSETVSRDGVLGPRVVGGMGLPMHGGHLEAEVPDAIDEIRTTADPEDDGARETLIRKEREQEERGH